MNGLQIEPQFSCLDPGQIEELMDRFGQLLDSDEGRRRELPLTRGQSAAASCSMAEFRRTKIGEVMQAKHTLEATLEALADAVVLLDGKPPGHGIVTWRRHQGREFPCGGYDQMDLTPSRPPLGTTRLVPCAHCRRCVGELESAKAAADDLLRKTFSHTCSSECGEWMIWSA